MKKIICFIVAITMICGTAVFAHPFKDTKGHWADSEIDKAYQNGFVSGDPDGSFRPDENITRAEFLKMLVADICGKANAVIPEEYADDSHWASKYYNFAKEQIYIPLDAEVEGIKPGNMSREDYDKPISRWEMAFLLSNSVTNVTGIVGNRTEIPFGDIDEIEKQYPTEIQDSIKNCYGLGLMNGDELGKFNSSQNGTRAEAAAVINRTDALLEKIIEQYRATAEEQQKQLDEYNEKIQKSLVTYEEIPTKNPVVTVVMDNNKKVVIELYPEYAPQTVANFVKLVKDGFYNGLTFHRIVPGFVIQGGDPNGDGSGGSGFNIKGEFAQNGFEQNSLKHTRGVISMARSQHFDSASSQFFICLDDCASLDGSYAAFGKVISGMDIIDEYAKTDLLPNDAYEVSKPAKTVVIKNMTVLMKH